MTIAINIKKEYPAQEVSSVIKSALLRDARVASYKEKRYTGICKRFEKNTGWILTSLCISWNPAC